MSDRHGDGDPVVPMFGEVTQSPPAVVPARFSASARSLAAQLAGEIPELWRTRSAAEVELAAVTDRLGRLVIEALALAPTARVNPRDGLYYEVREMGWRVGTDEHDPLAAWTTEVRPVLLREDQGWNCVLTDPREPWPPGPGALAVVGDGFILAGSRGSDAYARLAGFRQRLAFVAELRPILWELGESIGAETEACANATAVLAEALAMLEANVDRR